MKKRSIILPIVAAISIFGILILELPRITIALISAKYGVRTSYASARITPYIGDGGIKDLKLNVDLKDVRIRLKKSLPPAYNTLDSLVLAPLDGTWKYNRIYGILRPKGGKVLIDTLTAEADEIKASVKGTFFHREDKADLDMVIYFSPKLLEKVPPELSDTILKDAEGGWKSLSVSISGDFKSPAIQITGRLFRLNIREISGS